MSLALTKEEQRMFDGELGEASRESMEILVALGKIFGAEGMIPITSAQVSGVSFKTIGQAGLDYLSDLSRKGAKVNVPTFLNPAGMDREQWREMGIPEAFAKKQIEVLDAFSSMGIMKTCTCAPYNIGIRPKKGEHIAWAESSAVAFANSILGARTNREGGPSALAAAICGVTPMGSTWTMPARPILSWMSNANSMAWLITAPSGPG
jgi:predicted aconitase